MLEYFFKRRSRLRQLRRGPLSEHLDGLASELRLKGYIRIAGQQILSICGRFSVFARIQGIEKAERINEALAERFLKEELAVEGDFKYAPNALQHLFSYLRRNGVITVLDEDPPTDPFAELLNRFDVHLRDVRGLAQITREAYLRGARRFLKWYQERHPQRKLEGLRGTDILNFITEFLEQPLSDGWKKHLCCQTRIFLRYLRWEGVIDLDLDRTVPSVPHWRLAKIPRHLPWEQIQTLIDSIDILTPEGKRDKAILLLIAKLGLRNKEVRSLQLSHIAWRVAEIHLPRTKSLKERMIPLTRDVGEALADYILNGRPAVDNPHIFLSHRAPRSHYLKASGISSIVKKRLLQAGIKAPSYGAHMLRHSLATRMVNVGVPIGEIADLLGHASIDTTAIYTKVDVTHLAAVALPFLEGGAE